MTSKQRNDNIGHMVCLMDACREQVAVRKNRSGKFYFDCPEHGRITPNLPAGQELILERASIWGEDGAPSDCARWIAEQWSWGAVMRNPEGRAPVNGAAPVPEGAPVDEPAPVQQPDPVDEAPRSGAGAPPPPPEPEPEPTPQPEAEDEPEYEEGDFA
ncbi:hypothetical protein [Marinobacter sp.]|uniref:hypothetical protein n=1 Tax=Marinobacter sp. TaxID=50741 RepID=UPI0035C74005